MVGNSQPFRVVFEGIVGGDRYTDLAIAYVSFSRDCAAGNWTSKADWNKLPNCQLGFMCTNTTDCISIDWVKYISAFALLTNLITLRSVMARTIAIMEVMS